MPSEDKTYCANSRCENTKCERHQIHINLRYLFHSYTIFENCPDFKGRGEDNGLFECSTKLGGAK